MVWLPFVWTMSLEPSLCVIGKHSPTELHGQPDLVGVNEGVGVVQSTFNFRFFSFFSFRLCVVLYLLNLEVELPGCFKDLSQARSQSKHLPGRTHQPTVYSHGRPQQTRCITVVTVFFFLTKLNFYWTFVFLFCQFSLFLSFPSASSVYTFRAFMLVFVSEHMCGAQGYLRYCSSGSVLLYFETVSHWLRTYQQG